LIRIPITIQDRLYRRYFDSVRSEIARLRPRFLGLGAFTSDYDFVMHFSREIKEHFDLKIVVGNVHASIQPEDFIFEGSPVDIAVIGEGELTLSEVLKSGGNGNRLEGIDGICFYDQRLGRTVATRKRKLIPDLSILPIPAYSDIDMRFYTRPFKRIIGYAYHVAMPIFTGRGCPFRCRFCASNNVWGGSSIRQRPISSIVDEIRLLVDDYKVDAIFITDDTFTIDKKRVKEFCDSIKPFKLTWAAQTRVNLINEEMVKTMRESGCVQLTFGVESGSQRLLDLMQKGCRIEDVREAFRLCRKYKVRSLANMMFNLPEEDEEDVRLSYKIFKEIKPDEFGLGLTVAYPGTQIYEKYFPEKLRKDEYYLLAEARGFGKGRFRLSRHQMDLERLLVDFRTDLSIQHLFPLFIRLLFSRDYWKMIRKSHYKRQYLVAIIKGLPVGLMRIGGTVTLNILKLFPAQWKTRLIKLATEYGKKYGN
jgi:radical SAM superfamily enzyme YgiQ (UPF0313 family)